MFAGLQMLWLIRLFCHPVPEAETIVSVDRLVPMHLLLATVAAAFVFKIIEVNIHQLAPQVIHHLEFL